MDSNYSKILVRLSTYRKSVNMTQLQMGEQFGVTQSHYAKLESGSKIISYQSLKCFMEHGGDVHFLITGEKLHPGKMDEYMSKCKSWNEKKNFFELLYWAINMGLQIQSDIEERLSDKTRKSLTLSEYKKQNEFIWENIRKNENLSQLNMTEILDINIKRYRRIEKNMVEPDAEILNTLYNKLHYSPMVFFDWESYYLNEMNRVWEEFSPQIRQKLEWILMDGLVLITESKSM